MKFHIETDRLLLREFRESDVEGIFELDSNPNVHRYLGNKPISTREEARNIVDSVLRQYDERGIGRWIVIQKQTGEFIGWSGLRLNTEYNMNGFTRYYDLGYRLIERHWGKGYATESGKAALRYAFEEMKLAELYASTEITNEASHRALLKKNFSLNNTTGIYAGTKLRMEAIRLINRPKTDDFWDQLSFQQHRFHERLSIPIRTRHWNFSSCRRNHTQVFSDRPLLDHPQERWFACNHR